jgi:hypothetical protein
MGIRHLFAFAGWCTPLARVLRPRGARGKLTFATPPPDSMGP